MADAKNATPVDLITGFLGAGKTTLLRQLLADPALSDTAVLINEFGEVGLDHLLLERIDETMVLLQSGCLCCSIREELADAIKSLLSRRDRGEVPPFRRLIIESTGIADPFPILSTIQADPVLRHHVRIGTVITVVDAVNGLDQLARQPECVQQVAAADRIVISKADLVDDAAVEQLTSALRRVSPDAALSIASATAFNAAALLTQSKARTPRLPKHDHGDAKHGTVSSFSLSFDQAVDWATFGLWLTMLLNQRGGNILRIKGILNVAGWDKPVALHCVQRLVHPPQHLRRWASVDRRSHLVFITRGIDPRAIRRSLAAFQVFEEQALAD